jgi:hypothetical protein
MYCITKKKSGGRSLRKSWDLNSERALENRKKWIELILVVDILAVKTCWIGGCFCRMKLRFQGGQNFITQMEWWLFALIASEGQVHWSPNFANNISRGSRLYFQDMRINNGVVVKYCIYCHLSKKCFALGTFITKVQKNETPLWYWHLLKKCGTFLTKVQKKWNSSLEWVRDVLRGIDRS